jgi:hypothetical protein
MVDDEDLERVKTEVHFVTGPKVRLVISHQSLEVFLLPLKIRLSNGSAVCAAEDPTGP